MTDKASVRQQTAEALRAKYRERTAPGQLEIQDLGLQALDCLEDLSACIPGEYNMFIAIADLIDPVCHNKQIDNNKISPVEFKSDNFICSTCEEVFFADNEGINHPIDWGFCPNCGARVLE